MKDSIIGIRIADGSYYPILRGGGGKSKRLVLTTVRDQQESVQIDLYRGEGDDMENATYIGSLMIENIESAGKGEPEVELILGIDRDGNLNATAGDQVTGERQSLSVSLTALDESEVYDIPDFEIEDDLQSLGGVTPEEESQLTSEDFDEEPEEEEEYIEEVSEKKKHPFLLVGFVVLALAVIVILALLLFKNLKGEEVPPLQAGEETAVEMAEEPRQEEVAPVEEAEVEEPAPEPVAEEPAAAEEPVAEKPEEPAPAPVETGGEWYRIKWGDTLWDISNAYYKNPWLYPVIAKENDIKNPDYILAGASIYIPAR